MLIMAIMMYISFLRNHLLPLKETASHIMVNFENKLWNQLYIFNLIIFYLLNKTT